LPPKPKGSEVPRPPYLRFPDAVHAIEEIYKQGGGNLALESLSPVLRNSARSSSFRLKVNSLRNLGLVDEHNGRVSLTPVAMAVVAPTTTQERSEALTTALRKIPMLKTLHDRYAGGMLPPEEALGNLLLREYNAKPPLNREWAEYFVSTLSAADLLDSVNGRAMVRRRPGQAQIADATSVESGSPLESAGPAMVGDLVLRPSAQANTPRGHASASQALDSADAQRVEMPLQGGGRASLMLPQSATAEDIEDLIGLLTVMKKRAQRQGGRGGDS
jgi:hypothetical protein